jgi:2',3'-cyclic-nucleotide 2'-phosphodiesterase (5'-nucleotidase family)
MTIMTRRTFVGSLLVTTAVLATGLTDAEAQAATRVTLVTTNDLDRMGEEQGRGGHPRLAAVVRAERAKGNTLFIHAGDAYSPSLLSGFDRGRHIVELLNAMRPDVFVPGNHEFDFGPAVFRERIAESRFPVLAGNIREANGQAPANTADSRIVEVAGFRIGFYGLTTETTPRVSSSGDIRFLPTMTRARELSAALRQQGADIVVAVVHIGFDEDQALVQGRLADVVISGHDHNLVTFYDGRTVLTESSSQADFVVSIDLRLMRAQVDGRPVLRWRPDFRIVDSADVTPDPEIGAVVAGHEQALDRELNVNIGVATTPMDSRRATVRSQESAMGNLIADAMREAVQADVGFTNGGGIRADRQYPAGHTLTRRDVLSELPFGNRTVLLELSGADLRAALEHGVSAVERGAGQFPQVSGMVVRVDLRRPAGQRVLDVSVGGQPLDPARMYRLATNDFMARGGDGYAVFSRARVLIDALAAQYMAGHVIAHVARLREVSPRVEGRLDIQR